MRTVRVYLVTVNSAPMNRSATLFYVATAPVLLSAQTWCPPGAEWLYGFGNQQAGGLTRAWYSGDTLLGGYTAQRIDQTIHAYQPMPPFGEAFTQPLNPLFTRHEEGVVHIWDPGSATYDTLIWFGAAPGQHWHLHHVDDYARFDVLDTGTRMVNGVPLRYLVVEEPLVMGVVDTVLERVGSDFFYIEPWETFMIDWTTAWLYCYRDELIDEVHGIQWSGTCAFNVSMPEMYVPGAFIAPNPGSDHFALELTPGAHTITVVDGTGRSLMNVSAQGARVVVGAAHLPSGIYFVRVDEGPATLRWVKN